MFYSSEITAVWGFIAHIPIAIVFLAFLSKQLEMRERGESLPKLLFSESNRKVLGKVVAAGLFGLAVLGTLSPISRFILN